MLRLLRQSFSTCSAYPVRKYVELGNRQTHETPCIGDYHDLSALKIRCHLTSIFSKKIKNLYCGWPRPQWLTLAWLICCLLPVPGSALGSNALRAYLLP